MSLTPGFFTIAKIGIVEEFCGKAIISPAVNGDILKIGRLNLGNMVSGQFAVFRAKVFAELGESCPSGKPA